MLTIDEASELCEFLADCHEEFPHLGQRIWRFLPRNLYLAVLCGYCGWDVPIDCPPDAVAYDVGRWCRENLG